MSVLTSREASRRNLLGLTERQHRLVRLEIPEMIRTAKRRGGTQAQLNAAIQHAEARLDFLNRVRSVLVTMPMEALRAWDLVPFEGEFARLIMQAVRELEPYGPYSVPDLDARLAVLAQRARTGRLEGEVSAETLDRLRCAAYGLASALCDVRNLEEDDHRAEVAQLAHHALRAAQTRPRHPGKVADLARMLNRSLRETTPDLEALAEARRRLAELVSLKVS
ncbi:MAG: hypothetical protein VKO21_04730 [Candidatus Sericytochromatia bacterium]|nr:hypothetical protein [Candidatus Sericytochromatia bacterium]